MAKNLYFRTMFKRQNIFKETILNFFLAIASYPRLVLEVFLRKNMGRRYFTLASAITVAVVFILIPFFKMDYFLPNSFSMGYYGYQKEESGFFGTIKSNWLWYIFTLTFCYFSYLRHKDVERIKSQFDMNHFSLSSGETLPFFHTLKYKGKPFSSRMIETCLEPLPFFIFGFLLLFLGQTSLGVLLVICSIVYALSYAGAYMKGDHFIMDIIDNVICNQELSRTFTNDEPTQRGFRFYGEKPESEALREEALDGFFDDGKDFSDAK